MDTSFIGIPSDGHAFSNNAFGNMGPLSFEQVRFLVPAAGTTTKLSLR